MKVTNLRGEAAMERTFMIEGLDELNEIQRSIE
jgi:hypothetical protein